MNLTDALARMDDTVTEFTYLDPVEIHLVKTGANGFAPLLAKAAAAVEDVINEADVIAVLKEAGANEWLCDSSDCAACTSALEKAKLKAKQRNALSDSDFAIPEERKYPINDENHARNALSRVSANGTPEEKKRVRAAVHKRYPDIGQEDAEKAMSVSTDESLSQTREVEGAQGAVHMANGQEAGDPPAKPQPTPDLHDGQGTTAPSKDIPKDEALSQTNAEKSEIVDMTGSKGPDLGDPAKTEALTQTDERTEKASKPADDEDEDGDGDADDDDAKKAASLLKEAIELLEAKKGAGEINQAINRATELLSGLVDGKVTNQVATEEIDVTKEELMELLDQRDAAKAAELAKASEPKPEETAAPEAAVKSGEDETVTVSKSEFESLKEMVKQIAEQSGPRVAVNQYAVRPAEAGRQGQVEASSDAFSPLRKQIAEAKDERALERSKGQLAKGIFAANERARLHMPKVVQGQGTPLLAPNPVVDNGFIG